jgi:crotonobetainyl-CoA:carnitine CoA-transferase CaiB-like acyl-CoA transferase
MKSPDMMAPGALSGLRVVEIANFMSGPAVGLLLADFGADVIKIEKPQGGDDGRVLPPYLDGDGFFYVQLDRNKRSVAVDMKHPKGRAILTDLAAEADILIDNFRPGTLRRFGLDYESLRDRNPRLIACSITGFGEGNEYTERAAYDPILQAMSGLMLNTGFDGDGPVRAGAPVVDMVTALLATIGILAALQARTVTGRGQRVEASLLGAAATIMGSDIFRYWAVGSLEPRLTREQGSHTLIPCLQTSDGRLVQISLGNHGIFSRVCEAGGRPELATDERFSSVSMLMKHGPELRLALVEMFSSHDYAFWTQALTDHGIPWGPVNTVAEFLEDPVVRKILVTDVVRKSGGRVPVIRSTIHLSENPAVGAIGPDKLGESTDTVLREVLHLSDQDIAALRTEGAIA